MILDIDKENQRLAELPPHEIVQWALSIAKCPVVTTNFRPYEAAILHLTALKKIKVIWCDTGYNTPETYKHAKEVIDQLNLEVQIYVPKQTTAYTNGQFGGIPSVDNPHHEAFSEVVKLEPFKRAMAEHKPDVWFTNLRKGQTTFRDTIDILSQTKDGILKVSPFYYWTDEQLDHYLKENGLPNETNYFDPTKVTEHRECGIHL